MQPWWLSPCYKRNCSANFRWRKYPQWLELLCYCHLKVPWSHVVLLWWWCCKVLHLFSSRCWVDASSAAAEWALLSGGALLPMGWALSGSSLGALTLPASGAAAGLHGCAAPSVTPHVSVLGETDFTWSLLLSQLPSGSLLCPSIVLEAKMVNGFYEITFMPCWMLLSAAVTRGDVCICSVKDMLCSVNKGRKCLYCLCLSVRAAVHD